MSIFYHLCFTYLNVSTLVFRQNKQTNIYVSIHLFLYGLYSEHFISHVLAWRTWRNLYVKSKILHLENTVEKMAKETSCYQEEICILCFGE